jgi:two-component system, LytTR family, sensor kinase
LDGSYFLAIFRVVKKVIYQIIFWLFYWLVNVHLDFYWVRDNIEGWRDSKILLKTSIGAFLYILPLIALAYYLVFFAFEKVVQKKNSFVMNAFIILIPYIISICLSIVIVRLIVFPFIYENAFQPGKLFFDPRRFLTIMIEAAFPAGLLMSLKYIDTQLASKEMEKNLIKEKLTTELQFLKNQLNPHFLFNTLNNIYALTRKKSDKAPEVVMKLSELLSFMLYESDKETISIQKEIKFLEDYISLEKIRYTDVLTVVFNKDIDDDLQQIAPLLLLPLAENAFKHGASENHFDSFIHINLTLKKQQLSFTVENSFEEPPENNKSNTIGLYNTSRQLELIYKEQKLEIVKADNVFKVHLEINLNSYGKI